ncbi:MAG: radical SAM/Cys-rich domain protein [Candidatus Latescibacteria bacterium]|nr:radical SAM/Cys-rich domain protein [Candidatus Latescibacterota bacterium]NIM21806.1 radical SAM/Cys-rich domain protein [Candidatus Latescibacterota bacterium]NIM65944.1 radical SAM/Cys-rich domain protein [Candidatus Latescibacterota bacterium]NIO02689.1 radical SAM/Cys-rich domain protein [Candidatus Latescibacterota bacterium]NIO29670.1 radical SAM/Cys-rich domain protein [Candidatus Latescibacterota bacterium]
MNAFDMQIREATGHDLESVGLSMIQVNVGLVCNQQCFHCHVAASPNRKEVMSWETMEHILKAARAVRCELIDITGGAPELNPHFERFVSALRDEGLNVQVRTNLTVLLEPGKTRIPEFYKKNKVQLVASLPCYLEENVRKQRGVGVYEKSIGAIKILNGLGYGIEPELPLNLVYNPVGPHLPPNQADLEADYRKELSQRFGIHFTKLLTITNMPIGRFIGDLRRQKKEKEYWDLLINNFNPRTVEGLMCRHQISVDWDGDLYECDFNLALKMSVDHGAPTHIRDFDPATLARRRIVTGKHCFGCTAGCGSSCGGALV